MVINVMLTVTLCCSPTVPTLATLANVSLLMESANDWHPPQHKVHVSTKFYLMKPSGSETDVRGGGGVGQGSTSAGHSDYVI